MIPVLNEKPILASALNRLKTVLEGSSELSSNWEVLISDAGSSDGSVEIAKEFCLDAQASAIQWKLQTMPLNRPSVGSTVAQGVSHSTGEVILILPADCHLSREAIEDFVQAMDQGGVWGGFPKKYFPATRGLRVYESLQNRLRLKKMRHLVWTNGIFFRRELLANLSIPQVGFMEDVILSDHLRLQAGFRALRHPIHVSARRYYPDRKFFRIRKNILILGLFRSGWVGVDRLRRMYLSTGHPK